MASIGAIIQEWGEEFSTAFGKKGKNISPTDRAKALKQLFQELKKEGYKREDLDFDIKRIVKHCVPSDSKLRNEGWVFVVVLHIREILDEVYPDSEPGKRYIEEVENVCKYLGVKFTKKKQENEENEKPDTQKQKETEKPKRFNFEEIDKEPNKKKSILEVDNIEKLLKERYTISKDREEQRLLPKIDKDIMELFGLDENGELK